MGTRLIKPLQQSWGGIPAKLCQMLSTSNDMHDSFALMPNVDSHLPLSKVCHLYITLLKSFREINCFTTFTLLVRRMVVVRVNTHIDLEKALGLERRPS